MADYSVLGNVVAVAGSLIAASSAIGLAWMRRAKWMPPHETVAGATAKVSALICAVLVAVLYLLRQQIGFTLLAYVAVGTLLFLLVSLGVSIYVNTAYSFNLPGRGKNGGTRILGGFKLTIEAKQIAAGRSMSQQALLENANGKVDLVWTKGSQAALQVVSTMGFIALQVCGSLALSTAAMLVSISASKPL